MLLFVDNVTLVNLLSQNNDHYVVFNYSSMVQEVDQLDLLPYQIGLNISVIDPIFDYNYFEAIYNNNFYFLSFFKIPYYLFRGYNVVIVVNRSEVMDLLAESLAKIVQQRFGYNYQILNDINDFNRYDESNFSIDGIANYELDLNRAISLKANYVEVNGIE